MWEEHRVVFRPDKGQTTGKITQTNAGLLTGMNKWESCVTRTVWVTSHSINGLGPVRPVVVFTTAFQLPAMKCLELKA